MDLGLIGLGRMGANMAERLARGGHRVVGFARHRETVEAVVRRGAEGAGSLDDLIGRLSPPRVVWLMLPAGETVDATLRELWPRLAPGDTVVDGGNSYYRDTVRRAEEARAHGVAYVDVGTSGGIWGLAEGYSLMIGGERASVERLRPLFATLAPAPDRGWGWVGPSGAGHFVKMVHNGIEYGLMEAYAEGFSVLAGKAEFGLDLARVAEIWRHGSVVRSWLLDLASAALGENPELKGIRPYVVDSGEGRWTVLEAIDLGVSTPVIASSLLRRLRSREDSPFGDRLLAVLRQRFGGHAVRSESADGPP
jgi:6-phosphogluconate dehydrogenase